MWCSSSFNNESFFVSDLPGDHPIVATLREYDEKERIKKLRKSYHLNEDEDSGEEKGEEGIFVYIHNKKCLHKSNG